MCRLISVFFVVFMLFVGLSNLTQTLEASEQQIGVLSCELTMFSTYGSARQIKLYPGQPIVISPRLIIRNNSNQPIPGVRIKLKGIPNFLVPFKGAMSFDEKEYQAMISQEGMKVPRILPWETYSYPSTYKGVCFITKDNCPDGAKINISVVVTVGGRKIELREDQPITIWRTDQ